MSKIKISTEEVRAIAGNIHNHNKTLNEKLTEIQNTMIGLKSNWQSEACETVQNRFNSVANKYFNEYYEIVESYAKFLEITVADNYETTEAALKSNAEAFD